jgi:phosphoribosylformylglycinamidine cyclo-ligase
LGKTIGEILLIPTKIYVKETIELLKNVKVHGIAHITGGGLRNLLRLNKNVKFVIDNPFEPLPIFKVLQKYGNIEDKEMYQTFNMGMGLVIIVSEKDTNKSIKILKKHSDSEVKIIGKIEKGKGVDFPKLGLKY